MEAATAATRGRWVFTPPSAAGATNAAVVAEGTGGTGLAVEEGGGDGGGGEAGGASSAAPPPPKLVGNRFWRPLPHVIGTQAGPYTRPLLSST